MLKKLKQIQNGWINYLSENPNIKPLAEERAIICSECPLNVRSFCSKSKGGCGCYIPAKICCETCKCPKEKW